MRVLVVCNKKEYIEDVLDLIKRNSKVVNENTFLFKLKNHVDILETGYGGFRVGMKVTETLIKSRYNLVLKLSEAIALHKNIEVGQVVNVIRDFPADHGELSENSFQDLYGMHEFSTNEPPHQLGGLVNKTNSYMNIFLPYKKVFSLTAGISSHNEMLRKIRIEKYKPHIETPDGLYFAYPCLWRRVSFYHLAAVSENLITGKKNRALAKEAMNREFVSFFQKL